MGSGVGLFDYDQDGWLDIVVGQGSRIPRDASDGEHHALLYHNNHDGTFREVANEAGVAFRGYAQGVAIGDVDGDGRDDLYLSGFNSCALYHNDGNGRFTDMTDRSGLRSSGRGWSSSCAFADLDGDGDLDLFVVRYLADTVDAQGRPTANCNALPGQIGYCPPRVFAPEPDGLYRNNGDGTFTDVTVESGIAKVDGNGLGLAIADLDDDGRPEIFVANDKTPNLLWHNRGNLKFEEVGLAWGVAYNESGDAMAGMGVAVGDADEDGRIDLIVTNFYEEGVTFYRNTGPGQFEVATARSRLRLPTRSKLGFGTGLVDFDRDGKLDLFITNGHVNDVRPLRMPYQMTPQIFRNEGQGRFLDESRGAGPYFQELWLGRGAAFGDLDNDGDPDIVVSPNTGPPALLRNEANVKNHALQLVLVARGPKGQRVLNPVGTRVEWRQGDVRRVRVVAAGTSYLSRSDPRVTIGLGAEAGPSAVEVHWPSGRAEVFKDVAPDRWLELNEGSGEPPARR
ncbi:MAG: CRTAC1 family protein [Isosphaeraceae bacterium]